jgi:hypothetical protein
MNTPTRTETTELSALLWALKENATWSWKLSLESEGEAEHSLPALEASWRNIEQHFMRRRL